MSLHLPLPAPTAPSPFAACTKKVQRSAAAMLVVLEDAEEAEATALGAAALRQPLLDARESLKSSSMAMHAWHAVRASSAVV